MTVDFLPLPASRGEGGAKRRVRGERVTSGPSPMALLPPGAVAPGGFAPLAVSEVSA
jgi:hypothetical protein